MIKNIPNKMTDKELIAYINNICPRRIDFLYLRMDFQNGCNVGYAFVNFINVEDLLRFAKMALGEKWNMYSSEKVLQMSYANYQGKEALVEKFKNSCIMDEREEWRPKIFYSEPGPKQGLPEEFPKPTHMRRKERSSYNRGALFVPGINGTGQHKTFLNATPPNQRNSSNRSSAAPHGDERRTAKTQSRHPGS
ncbi:RNA recognition motif 2-domain-containing protein [Melanogaster broomeanus]|nr:RNA recognition motif 2-domain-containing protein [Melanogaster broomeanus]